MRDVASEQLSAIRRHDILRSSGPRRLSLEPAADPKWCHIRLLPGGIGAGVGWLRAASRERLPRNARSPAPAGLLLRRPVAELHHWRVRNGATASATSATSAATSAATTAATTTAAAATAATSATATAAATTAAACGQLSGIGRDDVLHAADRRQLSCRPAVDRIWLLSHGIATDNQRGGVRLRAHARELLPATNDEQPHPVDLLSRRPVAELVRRRMRTTSTAAVALSAGHDAALRPGAAWHLLSQQPPDQHGGVLRAGSDTAAERHLHPATTTANLPTRSAIARGVVLPVGLDGATARLGPRPLQDAAELPAGQPDDHGLVLSARYEAANRRHVRAQERDDLRSERIAGHGRSDRHLRAVSRSPKWL